MPQVYERRAISIELDDEIKNIIHKIQDSFGIKPSVIDATKIIAWKSKNYSITLTSKRLKDILRKEDNDI